MKKIAMAFVFAALSMSAASAKDFKDFDDQAILNSLTHKNISVYVESPFGGNAELYGQVLEAHDDDLVMRVPSAGGGPISDNPFFPSGIRR